MGWKNWPYWFKVGIIVSLISLFVSSLLVKTVLGCFNWADSFPSYCNIPVLIFFSAMILSIAFGYSQSIVYISIIVNALLGFVFGAILGVIIDKIKSKK